MSRSASSHAPRGRPESGFTLIEAAVALAVGGILAVVVVRFYKDSYKTFSTSEQIAERDQNAHFVMNKFVEVLQQAGSALPDTGWPSLRVDNGILIVGSNPRGADHYVGQAAALNVFVAVGDATPFVNTGNVLVNVTHVLLDYADPATATAKFAIDVAYNARGFTNGVKNNAFGLDSIRLTTGVLLNVGDRIFGYREDHYLASGGNLIIRPNGATGAAEMALAENIDSLGFTFRNSAGAATTDWKNMRSASLLVRARTAKPDPHLPPPGYRKITLPMNVILRNRI